jgi:hypothetical protein
MQKKKVDKKDYNLTPGNMFQWIKKIKINSIGALESFHTSNKDLWKLKL